MPANPMNFASRVVPSVLPLRVAMLCFVLGTVKYAERDVFHDDVSFLQPFIEVGCITIGTIISLGVAVLYRVIPPIRMPYVLLLISFIISFVSSLRSWDPLFSATKGILLLMVSFSIVALAGVYGVVPLARMLINAYIVLLLFGIFMGIIMPSEYPLFSYDPGEESIRARLHLFKSHPIAIADASVICLILSVLLHGTWMRICRVMLLTCLLLTVARASIIVGLPLYLAAEFFSTENVWTGIRRLTARIALATAFTVVLSGAGVLLAGWNGVENASDSLASLVEATTTNTTLSGRTTLWSILLEDLSWDNLYGYGPGGARYYLRTINPWFSHSHNSALETIYMSGYLGLITMLGAMTAFLFHCVSLWRMPQIRVLTITGIYVIVIGMMNPSWYDTGSVAILSILCILPAFAVRPQCLPSVATGYTYASSPAH